MLWCIPTAIYFFLFVTQRFHFEGLWHLTSIIPAAIGFGFLNKYRSYSSGIKGENRTISIVEKLPDGYEAFTSIPVEYDNKKAELDIVVVGKNGIFIIEVKNHNGTIVGSYDDYNFTQHKVGQKGGEYTSSMNNPIKQVKKETWILSNILKSKQVNAWIQGVVFFSNPSTTVNIQTDHIPVFDAKSGVDDLIEYLIDYEPKKQLNEGQILQLKSILLELQK